ncbi:Sorting nexin-19 [Halotydeus destructor]|nr:Sorting nexin-19 [Halotydeus destructor]
MIEALIAVLIALCLSVIYIESIFSFIVVGLVCFLLVKYTLERCIKSCIKANEVPPLMTVSIVICKLNDFRKLFVNNLKSKQVAAISKTWHCSESTSYDNELETIVDHIVEDYILIWYNLISPDNQDFVDDLRAAVKKIFVNFLSTFLTTADRDKFLSQVLSLLTENLCDENFSHSIIYENEDTLVRKMVEKFMVRFAPSEVLDLKSVRCTDQQHRDSLYILVRELLTKAVMIPIVTVIAEPNWIYEQLYLLFKSLNEPVPEVQLLIQNNQTPTKPSLLHPVIGKLGESCPSMRASSISLNTNEMGNYLTTTGSGMRRSKSVDLCGSETSSMDGYDPSTRGSDDEVSDCESGIEIGADSQEPGKMDNRLFTNIQVRQTEEAGSRGDRYVVYCIRYDGLAEEVTEVDKKSIVRFVRREMLVKRRFRECVALQNRLEENVELKKYLKRVKRPSKLRVTPNTIFGGATLERDTIARRKLFLETFLTDLSNREPIANSKEMRTFMAYGSDARIAYVKTTASSLPLRIDKVFMEGVSGVANFVRKALPVDALIPDGGFGLPLKIGSNPKKALIPVTTKIGDSLELDMYMCQWRGITSSFDSVSNDGSPMSTHKHLVELADDAVSLNSVQSNMAANNVEHSDNMEELHARLRMKLPLSCSVIDLISAIYNEGSQDSVYVLLFEFLFGHLITRLLHRQLEETVTKNTGVYLLHLLHESVWAKESDHLGELNQLDKSYTAVHAERAIKTYLKKSVPGYSVLSYKIDRALNFLLTNLQLFERNKLFVYQVIGMAIDEVAD